MRRRRYASKRVGIVIAFTVFAIGALIVKLPEVAVSGVAGVTVTVRA